MSQAANNLFVNLAQTETSEVAKSQPRDTAGRFTTARKVIRTVVTKGIITAGLVGGVFTLFSDENVFRAYQWLDLEGRQAFEKTLPSPEYVQAVLEGIASDNEEAEAAEAAAAAQTASNLEK